MIGAVDSFATVTVTNEVAFTTTVSNLVSDSSTNERSSATPGPATRPTAPSNCRWTPPPTITSVQRTYVQRAFRAHGLVTNAATTFERGIGFPVPHFWLSLRTRARFILVDTALANRIIDYVNLDSTEPPLDITLMAQTNGLCEASYIPDGSPGSLWCTTAHAPLHPRPPYGVLNQIGICLGSIQPNINAGRWNNAANGVNGSTTTDAINFFRGQVYNELGAAVANQHVLRPLRADADDVL